MRRFHHPSNTRTQGQSDIRDSNSLAEARGYEQKIARTSSSSVEYLHHPLGIGRYGVWIITIFVCDGEELGRLHFYRDDATSAAIAGRYHHSRTLM